MTALDWTRAGKYFLLVDFLKGFKLGMRSFFARHDTEEEREARRTDPDSPAAIAWGLWGGTPGRRWAERVLREAGV